MTNFSQLKILDILMGNIIWSRIKNTTYKPWKFWV